MPESRPNPLVAALGVAGFVIWLALVAALTLWLSGCSSAPVQLPARDVGRALCALEVVEQLPPDPKRVSVADVENVIREYKYCISLPDGGAP